MAPGGAHESLDFILLCTLRIVLLRAMALVISLYTEYLPLKDWFKRESRLPGISWTVQAQELRCYREVYYSNENFFWPVPIVISHRTAGADLTVHALKMPRFKLSYIWSVMLLVFLTLVFYKRETSYSVMSKGSSINKPYSSPLLEVEIDLPALHCTPNVYLKEGETMADRLAHIHQVCNKHRITPNVTNISDFLTKHPPSPQYSVFYFDTWVICTTFSK